MDAVVPPFGAHLESLRLDTSDLYSARHPRPLFNQRGGSVGSVSSYPHQGQRTFRPAFGWNELHDIKGIELLRAELAHREEMIAAMQLSIATLSV